MWCCWVGRKQVAASLADAHAPVSAGEVLLVLVHLRCPGLHIFCCIVANVMFACRVCADHAASAQQQVLGRVLYYLRVPICLCCSPLTLLSACSPCTQSLALFRTRAAHPSTLDPRAKPPKQI